MRVVIIGGPRSGKSTMASKYSNHYCTDPKSLVKDILPSAQYLPEGLKWGDDSQFICDNWFTMRGSWIIEGVGAVRALRKWDKQYHPCDVIVVLKDKHPLATRSDGQEAMSKAVMNIWYSIEMRYRNITKYA
jgi:hypothetical protein